MDVVEQVVEDTPHDASSAKSLMDDWEPIEEPDRAISDEPEAILEDEPAQEGYDVWGQVLPQDPNLPHGYAGKPIKDLYDNERNLIKSLQEKGEEQNRLKAQNELLTAALAQTNRERQYQQPTPAEAAEERSFFEQIGIDPNDVFDHPEQVLTVPLEALRDEFYGLVDQLRSEISGGIGSVQRERTMEKMQVLADEAWLGAAADLGFSEDAWRKITPAFIQNVIYDKKRTNPMIDKEAYKEAYAAHAAMWGEASGQSSFAQAAGRTPSTANNPPVTSRQVSTGASGTKKLPKHIEREVADFARATGHTEEWVRKAWESEKV